MNCEFLDMGRKKKEKQGKVFIGGSFWFHSYLGRNKIFEILNA